MTRKYLVFDNAVAPVHDGIYQRKITRKWLWAKCEKGTWYVADKQYSVATSEIFESAYQVGDKGFISTLEWRGLKHSGRADETGNLQLTLY